MFYLVLFYFSVKLTFITQKYMIFLLAVLGHHSALLEIHKSDLFSHFLFADRQRLHMLLLKLKIIHDFRLSSFSVY